jgi:2-C-methyl-D-erythritol 4-phosphate cytidylyltransferase/2-C-methyl-D-erythritol 2,4-cyclodiphosphate synthase
MSKNAEINGQPGFHVLIPAAGTASRMGLDIPKPYISINNFKILRYSIEKFIKFKDLKSLQVIIHPDHSDLYHEAVKGLDLPPPITGSTSRKKSVYNGLCSFSESDASDTVLIHDAARPLVQAEDIQNLLGAMTKTEAATLACPVSDTLYRSGETVDRDGLWAIQTPQAFKIGALKKAHEKFKDDEGFTDDAGLMRAMGYQVEIVPASRINFKITTAEDLKMAEALLQQQKQTRTASGFDVHAFEKAPTGRRFMLGGLEIDHDVALSGHSDADVILHAVTDALLGTINAGDIGTHFPPSDPLWKDADSALFLKEAGKMLMDKGGIISLLDITVMAETPKIGPHREAMQHRIADILKISPQLVSIKATTTEGLGFTGRKEGIACQALATITL